MTLLCELQPAIAAALNSLGEKPRKSVADLFYLYAASHISIAVEAFILLRRERCVDGARLVVRPALETMLRLRAVRVKPHLLYRVLFGEALEIDKWFGGVAKRHGIPYIRVCDSELWQAVKARCVSEFGTEKLADVPLTSYGAAAAIGIESYYETHYRAYCQYTHGALEAVSGALNELTDPEDTRVMLSSAMTALEALVQMGAYCPNEESFCERFNNLITKKADKLFRQKPT
jgi:hypothetical protein